MWENSLHGSIISCRLINGCFQEGHTVNTMLHLPSSSMLPIRDSISFTVTLSSSKDWSSISLKQQIESAWNHKQWGEHASRDEGISQINQEMVSYLHVSTSMDAHAAWKFEGRKKTCCSQGLSTRWSHFSISKSQEDKPSALWRSRSNTESKQMHLQMEVNLYLPKQEKRSQKIVMHDWFNQLNIKRWKQTKAEMESLVEAVTICTRIDKKRISCNHTIVAHKKGGDHQWMEQ